MRGHATRLDVDGHGDHELQLQPQHWLPWPRRAGDSIPVPVIIYYLLFHSRSIMVLQLLL